MRRKTVFTDSEAELLLRIILNYKKTKLRKNVDWETCLRKSYGDIIDEFVAQYPREPTTTNREDFPHVFNARTSKAQLVTKIKSIRNRYKAAVDAGGKNKSNGRVRQCRHVYLFFELCSEIWGGGSPPVTRPLDTGTETGSLEVQETLTGSLVQEEDNGNLEESSRRSSTQTSSSPLPRNGFTNCEVELLLRIILNYKKTKLRENVDWETCLSKYGDIIDEFVAQYPREPTTTNRVDFPHVFTVFNARTSKAQLVAKIKNIRTKYRVSVGSRRKKGIGHHVYLFFELCSEIWGGGSPPATRPLGTGTETGSLEVQETRTGSLVLEVVEDQETRTGSLVQEEDNGNLEESSPSLEDQETRTGSLILEVVEDQETRTGSLVQEEDNGNLEESSPSPRRSSTPTSSTPLLHLPLSSLRLIVPPLQLVSAALLEIVKKGAVMHYGMLEEFVSTVLETVPDLLTYREGAQLVMGLRARVVLELCRTDELPSPHTVQTHLTRIKTHITKTNKERSESSDLEVRTSMTNFSELVNSLVDHPGQRDAFYQNIFPTVFGPKYDAALEALMMKFLSSLQKLLPVPNLEQTADWLSLSPSILKECVEFLNQPQPLNTLIQHHKRHGHLVLKGLSSSGEDCILSSLSHHFQKASSGEDCILSSLSHHFQKANTGTSNTPANSGSMSAAEGWQCPIIDDDSTTVEKWHETTWNVVGGEERHDSNEALDLDNSVEAEPQHDQNDSSDIESDKVSGHDYLICLGCDKTFIYPKNFDKHQKSCVVMNKIDKQSSAALPHNPLSQPREKGCCSPTAQVNPLPEHSLSPEPSEEPMYKRSSRNKTCSICREIFTSCYDLTKHMRGHTEQSSYPCSCGKDFEHEEDCERHCENECRASNPHPQTKTDFAQEKSSGSSSKRNQRRAFSSSWGSSDPDEPQRKTRVDPVHPNHFVIAACNFQSTDQPHEKHLEENGRPTFSADLTEDQQRKPGGVFMCTMCDKNFVQILVLKRHYWQSHKVPRGSYPCPLCKRIFGRLFELVRHHQNQKLYQCSSCILCFTKLELLNKHKEVCNYTCETCRKSFKSLAHLNLHQKSHREPQPWICSYCDKQFKRKDGLNAHMVIHTSGYPCPTCGKKFYRMLYLKWHQQKHTGKYPYLCDTCGKGWPTTAQLKLHMVQHTEGRPFKCEDCGVCYKRQNVLNDHRRAKHLRLRPFVCEVCGKAFRLNCELKRHFRVVHSGERPYKCFRCRKTFKRRIHLRVHNDKKKCTAFPHFSKQNM